VTGRLLNAMIRLSRAWAVAPRVVPLMAILTGWPHSPALVYSVVDFDAPGGPDILMTTP
jgi:hypothetical protein